MDRTLNVKFSPLDSQGNAIIYVPNQSGDPVPSDKIFEIQLSNNGQQSILLKQGTPVSDQSIPSGNFLLSVFFPVSFTASDLEAIQIDPQTGWKAKSFSDDGLYLMLSPIADTSIPANGSIAIKFTGFKTSTPRLIPQSLNLNLYNLDSSIVGDGIYSINTVILQVPKAGNKDLVLFAGSENSSSIYLTPSGSATNNENDINFYLMSNDPNAITIPAIANLSYIRISFDTGDGLGDLTSAADAVLASISLLRNYQNLFTLSVERIQTVPTWKFTASTNVFLNGGSNDRLEFQLQNLISHIQPGIANVYLEFFDIPGFNDGYASFSLQKELPAAVISAFFISPNKIANGDSITLQWQTQGADYCTLSSNIGSISDIGGQTIPTYKTFSQMESGLKITPVLPDVQNSGAPVLFSVGLTAFTLDGRSNTKQIGILIEPVSCSLVASVSDPISFGSKVMLSWSSQYAHSLSIDQGLGSVSSAGSLEVSPTHDTVYTLTAQGLYGPINSSVVVHVQTVKINSFIASATSGKLGDQITFQWDTEFASSLDINGTVLTSAKGSIQLPLTHTFNTFTLTCNGGNGPVSQSISINTTDGVQIVSMSGYWQMNKFYFETAKANFDWQTAAAVSCQLIANGGVVSDAVSGTVSVDAGTGDAPQSVTFVLTAQGPGGPVSQSYTVNPNVS
ncbi:serine/threonine protein kinase [Leptospira langatensis]|uniref:Serine/threonine protein kinase n=1 Tax=Leptospira langatensis TaxID=2484983 RepID=A0A5F1ZR87_9LEPT|nr:serine/threonine protein kinase [Leptospira langatensis]TGK02627.1 serine/threonine protein kinase [Leptospira langatensis]TGL40171.1 serine/threonine protein kinase [Leptospira langatensis]